MANGHMKRYLTLLIIREIKATMRYHFTLVRVAIIKKTPKTTNIQARVLEWGARCPEISYMGPEVDPYLL